LGSGELQGQFVPRTLERLGRTMKHEEADLKACRDGREAKIALADCSVFYNNEPPHQAPTYHTRLQRATQTACMTTVLVLHTRREHPSTTDPQPWFCLCLVSERGATSVTLASYSYIAPVICSPANTAGKPPVCQNSTLLPLRISPVLIESKRPAMALPV